LPLTVFVVLLQHAPWCCIHGVCVAPVTGLPEQGFFLTRISRNNTQAGDAVAGPEGGGCCHSDERCPLASSVRQRLPSR